MIDILAQLRTAMRLCGITLQLLRAEDASLDHYRTHQDQTLVSYGEMQGTDVLAQHFPQALNSL